MDASIEISKSLYLPTEYTSLLLSSVLCLLVTLFPVIFIEKVAWSLFPYLRLALAVVVIAYYGTGRSFLSGWWHRIYAGDNDDYHHIDPASFYSSRALAKHLIARELETNGSIVRTRLSLVFFRALSVVDVRSHLLCNMGCRYDHAGCHRRRSYSEQLVPLLLSEQQHFLVVSDLAGFPISHNHCCRVYCDLHTPLRVLEISSGGILSRAHNDIAG